MIGSGDGLMNCDLANLIIDFRAKMSMEFISSQGFTVFMTKPFCGGCPICLGRQTLVCVQQARGQHWGVALRPFKATRWQFRHYTDPHYLQTSANSEKICKPTTNYSVREMGYKLSLFGNKFLREGFQAGISISLVDEDLLLPLLPCSAQVRFRLNSKWIIGNSCFRSTALHCIVRYI